MELVNEPRVSRGIWHLYLGLNLIVALGLLLIAILALTIAPRWLLLLIPPILLVQLLLLQLLRSLRGTRYILRVRMLIIKTSRLIALRREIHIPLEEIIDVERSLIPFALKLFGASFHGGYYHIPGLGRCFISMTNFEDGVLIKSRRGCYMITPREPEDFMELLTQYKTYI